MYKKSWAKLSLLNWDHIVYTVLSPDFIYIWRHFPMFIAFENVIFLKTAAKYTIMDLYHN